MNQGMMFLVTEPEKKLAVVLGFVLRGISLRSNDDGWRMVVAVTDTKGNKMVAFIQMSTIFDCWWYLNEHLTKSSAPLSWRVDKYAK